MEEKQLTSFEEKKIFRYSKFFHPKNLREYQILFEDDLDNT